MKERAFRFIVTAMPERCPTCTVQCKIFWPVETLAQLADWPAGCGELAWRGCLCAWNFNVARSPVFTGAEGRIRPNMTLKPH